MQADKNKNSKDSKTSTESSSSFRRAVPRSIEQATGDEAESLRQLREAQEQERDAASRGPFKWSEEIADDEPNNNR